MDWEHKRKATSLLAEKLPINYVDEDNLFWHILWEQYSNANTDYVCVRLTGKGEGCYTAKA